MIASCARSSSSKAALLPGTGTIVGATDKTGGAVIDKFYKIESFGRTLYHQLGIDPDTIVQTRSNRPVKLIAEDAPLIKEAIG